MSCHWNSSFEGGQGLASTSNNIIPTNSTQLCCQYPEAHHEAAHQPSWHATAYYEVLCITHMRSISLTTLPEGLNRTAGPSDSQNDSLS